MSGVSPAGLYSPSRDSPSLASRPSGTSDELNRIIQSRFRGNMLSLARSRHTRWPAPMGDQEIVYHDKVMQRVPRAEQRGCPGVQGQSMPDKCGQSPR